MNLSRRGNTDLPNGPHARHKRRIVDLREGDEFLKNYFMSSMNVTTRRTANRAMVANRRARCRPI